jgi:hypothetical protein
VTQGAGRGRVPAASTLARAVAGVVRDSFAPPGGAMTAAGHFGALEI